MVTLVQMPAGFSPFEEKSEGPRLTPMPENFDPFAPAERPESDTTFLGEVTEVAKGVPGGAVEMGATALRGAAAAQRGPPPEYLALLDDIAAAGDMDAGQRGELMRRIYQPDGELAKWTGTGQPGMANAEASRLRNAMRLAERGDLSAVEELRASAAADKPAPVTKRPLWQAGEAVSKVGRGILPASPGYEDSIGRQIGEGLGSLAAGVGVAAVPGIGGPLASTMFALGGAGEAADRAVQEGASEEEIARAAILGLGAGATDILPVETLLNRLPVPGARALGQAVKRFGGQRVMRAVGRIGTQAVIESAQEGGQQALQNLIAQEVYKPEQQVFEGVIASAGIGGAVGGIAGLGKEGVMALGRRRSSAPRGARKRAVDSVPPPSPEDEASPIPTADIQAGREEAADAVAAEEVNAWLRSEALPEIGQPARAVAGGQSFEGVVTDAWTDGSPGVAITAPDGTTMELTMDDLSASGGELFTLPMPAGQEEVQAERERLEAEQADEDAAEEEGVTAARQEVETAAKGAADATAELQREADTQTLYRDELEGAEADVGDQLDSAAVQGVRAEAMKKMGLPPDHDIAGDAERRDTFKTLYSRALQREHRRKQAEAEAADGSAASAPDAAPEPAAKPAPERKPADDAKLEPKPADAPVVENVEPAAEPAAIPEPVLKKDGTPFKTKQAAAFTARAKKMDAEPVEVEGGWALQPSATAPAPEPEPDLPADTRPRPPIEEMDPTTLETDAAAFQYKEGGDTAGVTERLHGVKQWDQLKSGVAYVWERADGKRFIADGHQRVGLAKRLADQNPRLDVRVFKETDGYSQADMRELAAEKNIAEGSGSAWDAATVFRDSQNPDAIVATMPPNSAIVRDARGLAKLDDELFAAAKASTDANPGHWAVIGEIGEGDRPLQDLLAQSFNARKPKNRREAELQARMIQADRIESESQESLFGAEDVAQSLYAEKARLMDGAIRRLSQDKRVFQSLERHADAIEQAGNQLTAENSVIAQEAGRAATLVERLGTMRGPVADELNAAARELHDGGKFETALQRVIAAVRAWDPTAQREAPAGTESGGRGAPETEGQAVETEPTAAELEAAGQSAFFEGEGNVFEPLQFSMFASDGGLIAADKGGPKARASARDPGRQVRRFAKTDVVALETVRVGLTHVRSPEDAAHVAAPFRKEPQETAIAIVLDKNDKLLGTVRHSIGTIDSAVVDNAAFLGTVAQIPGAESFYLAHQHPGGDPSQSGGDVRVNVNMSKLLDKTDIKYKGSVVVAPTSLAATFAKPGSTRPEGIRVNPGVRKSAAPVYRRRYQQVPAKGRPHVRDWNSMVTTTHQLLPELSGILFFDTRMNVVGTMALSTAEMAELRGKGAAARDIIRTMSEVNANKIAAVAKSTQENPNTTSGPEIAALQNIRRFGRELSSDGRGSGHVMTALLFNSKGAPRATLDQKLPNDGQTFFQRAAEPRLRATHSMSIANLRQALNQGSLTAPSVAITPAGVAHRWGGPESVDVIFKAGAIDAKRDNVTAGDAWTPTHPQVTLMPTGSRKSQRDAEARLRKDVASLPKARRDTLPTMDVELVDYRGRIPLEDAVLREALTALYQHRTRKRERFPLDTEAGAAWLADYFNEIGLDTRRSIFTGTDNYGRQRYAPATPANIIKQMKKDWRDRPAPRGAGEIAGRLTRPLRSLKDVRQEAGQRVEGRPAEPPAFGESALDQLSDTIFEYVETMGDAKPRHASSFEIADTLADRLVSARGNPDRAIELMRQDYAKAPDPPAGWADKVRGLLNEIQTGPLPYLEAKPMREVPLRDVAAVVVPKLFPKTLRDRMKAQGIKVSTKTEDQTDADLAALQSVPDSLFRREGAGTGAAEGVRIKPARLFDEKRRTIDRQIRNTGQEVFGKQFNVQLVESITAPDGGAATGAFSPAARMVYVALRSDEAGMQNTLYHEGLHYLRRGGAFTGPDGKPNAAWRTLERMAPKWREQYEIDARYGEDAARAPDAQDLLNEEAIAEALGDYAIRGQATGFGPTVRAALNRVLRFFRQLRNAVRGDGLRTWEDVFEQDIATGEAGQRADAMSREDMDRYLQAAWHGSPHRFDSFSTDAIGSGEGAQVYGWGLYFTETKEIADWYRERLGSAQGPSFEDLQEYFTPGRVTNVQPDGWADRVVSFEGDPQTEQWHVVVESVKMDASGDWQTRPRPGTSRARRSHQTAPTTKQIEADLGRSIKPGATYKVNLAPEADEYLLWDRPLSQQSDKVRAALERYAETTGGGWSPNAAPREAAFTYMENEQHTGQTIYRDLTRNEGDDRAASEALLAAGIRGVKYLDGNARGRNKGASFNYVIFDDSDVALEEIMLQRRRKPAPGAPMGRFGDLHTERGADGFAQALIPGTERRALAPGPPKLRSRVPQKPANEGLFAEPEPEQATLFQRVPPDADNAQAFDAEASRMTGADMTGAAEAVKDDRPRMERFVDAVKGQVKGADAVAAKGVRIEDRIDQTDLNVAMRLLAPPNAWSRKFPTIHKLVRDGIDSEIKMSVRIKRLNKDWDGITKRLSKDEFSDLTGLLFLGDAEATTFTDEELTQMKVAPKIQNAYRESRRYLDKLGRFVEQHNRSMSFKLLQRRTALQRMMAGERDMTQAEFRRLYTERARLLERQRVGDGDPEVLEREIAEASLALHGPEAPSERYAKRAEELDRLQPRIDDTRIRRREGYVPHKFFGSWRVFREAGTDAEGNPRWESVASETGFWDTRTDAIRAASHLSRKDKGGNYRVAPVEFVFPNAEGTQLSDAAHARFQARVSEALGVQGQDLQDLVQGVARRRFRRRIAGFSRYRTGAKGFSQDLDRVMRTHIGETVRYVTLDRLKFDAINTMEREGLSENRSSVQERPVLAGAVQQWFKDVNGQKQVVEGQVDALLNKPWLTPLWGGAAAAGVTFAATGGLFGVGIVPGVVAGYIGYRVGRGIQQGGNFPSRAITGSILGDMSHLKLGMVFNLMSAAVNTTQVVLNTAPVLGAKHTGIGIKRLERAIRSKLMGKPNADFRLMARHDIIPLDNMAEGTRHQFRRESLLSKASMLFFTGAEGFNRGTTFLGAYNKAIEEGQTPAAAQKYAQEVMIRTQFHYGTANKPEPLRNVFLRVPFQFKNFVAQQISFAFGLSRKELPRFMLSMALLAGTLGIPGLDAVDEIMQALFDWSPISAMKMAAIDALAEGELVGGMATFLTRGVPGLGGVDMTGRVGLGDKFLPLSVRDWKGPWVGTLENAIRHGEEATSLADQIRNISPGVGNPLKMLEVMNNGGVVTNPWKRGRPEYQMTPDEMALKLVGARPIREARMQDIRDAERLETERRGDLSRRYVDRILAARNAGDVEGARDVMRQAQGRGVPISAGQIKGAARAMGLSRSQRELLALPRDMRGTGLARRQAVAQ